jgi:hypothetical protein
VTSEVVGIIRDASIIPMLAPSSGVGDGEPIPDGIIGARILGFGTIDQRTLPSWMSPVETAALVIDYLPSGATSARRVAFGASELAIWVGFLGDVTGSGMRDPKMDG